MKLEIQPLTLEAIAYVIANMTEEDRQETIAANIDPIAAFTKGFEESPISGTFSLGDRALAIFGCMPDPNNKGVGIPWMVATPEFRKHPRDGAQLTMEVVEGMNHHFKTLHNYVHCQHAVAKRWLTWCGFLISETLTGPGNQFHYFIRHGDANHV